MGSDFFKKNNLLFIVIALALVGAGGVIAARKLNLVSRLDNLSSNPNPLIRHFAPTWRSMKKIIDVPYLAASAFMVDNPLPIYEIELTKNDLANLLKNLPGYPEENRLYEFYKRGVKGTLRFGDYETTDAKIRYRGNSPNHWNAIKKSWHINLPDDQPMGERTTLRFFIGEDKGWIKGLLWSHIAEKLHLMSPKMEAVNLVVNKKQMGVYILGEAWEQSLLERHQKPLGRLFANKNMPITNPDFFRPESASLWYDRFEKERAGETFPELTRFLSLITSVSDKEFMKNIGTMLDTESFFKWTLAAMLSGDFVQLGNGNNINMYLNPSTGKLEQIFFDAPLVELNDPIDISGNRLVNRMLKQDVFKKQFEIITASYVGDISHLEDDLTFYDAQTEKLLPVIYRDTTKIQTTLEARKQIARQREAYRHNFLFLKSMLETGGLRLRFAEESYPLP